MACFDVVRFVGSINKSFCSYKLIYYTQVYVSKFCNKQEQYENMLRAIIVLPSINTFSLTNLTLL